MKRTILATIVSALSFELFAKALKEKGLLSEFISVPNGQHGPVTI
jgi:hypothetical protein